MNSAATPGHGYEFKPQELTDQVVALAALGERTNGLVNSANRLADRLPMLGTAPPAMHVAMRLREAAGQSGLTREIGATNSELENFHRALKETVTSYLEGENNIASVLRTAGGAAT